MKEGRGGEGRERGWRKGEEVERGELLVCCGVQVVSVQLLKEDYGVVCVLVEWCAGVQCGEVHPLSTPVVWR